MRCAPPRGKGQPAVCPQIAQHEPDGGARAALRAGRVECAAIPANRARARWPRKRDSARLARGAHRRHAEPGQTEGMARHAGAGPARRGAGAARRQRTARRALARLRHRGPDWPRCGEWNAPAAPRCRHPAGAPAERPGGSTPGRAPPAGTARSRASTRPGGGPRSRHRGQIRAASIPADRAPPPMVDAPS